MSAKGRRANTGVLNFWLGLREKAWLEESAAREGMSVTVFLRFLIRREMERAPKPAELSFGPKGGT